MKKDWNVMSRKEQGELIRKIIRLFEDDEKLTKIAYDYVEMPYEVVRHVVMKYLELIDEVDNLMWELR